MPTTVQLFIVIMKLIYFKEEKMFGVLVSQSMAHGTWHMAEDFVIQSLLYIPSV